MRNKKIEIRVSREEKKMLYVIVEYLGISKSYYIRKKIEEDYVKIVGESKKTLEKNKEVIGDFYEY